MKDKPILHPYVIEAPDGSPIAADIGRVVVPENRENPASPMIEVAFLRVRSTARNPGTPVFQVYGGPGGRAIDNVAPAMPLLLKVRETADYVHVEQRGVGQSRPRLDIPGTVQLPFDEPATWERTVETYGDYLTRGVRFWREQGRDLMGYNVREMAHDVDAVREALGYERICQTGASFGSHFSMAVLRYHGDRVERCVLRDLEGPNHTVKLPSTVTRYLQLYDRMVRDDAALFQYIPGFLALLLDLLHRLEHRPVTATAAHPETGKAVAVTMGKLDLQMAVADGLGSTAFLRSLPRRLFEMSRGDFAWLAGQVARERVFRRGNLMPALVDVASGATAARWDRIRREIPDCLLGNAINGVLFDVADRLGNPDLGDSFRSDLRCDVPTLFCSPGLDARTPVSNADEVIAGGFTHAAHQIVDGVSHDFVLTLTGAPLEQHIGSMAAFLTRGEVTTTRIAVPFAFEPIG